MENTSKGRVLLVEDEAALRRAFARMLEGAGFSVAQAGDGRQALAALAAGAFEVVLTDISMPGMDGIQLLRAVREKDLDVPVILITGNPTTASAIEAVQHGALQYLVKPVDKVDLVAAVERAARLGRLAALKREAVGTAPDDRRLGDRAAMEASLDRCLATLWMAYQPIVDWKKRRIIAFEALVRSAEPTVPHPGVLFGIAERLGRLHEVGRTIRRAIGATLVGCPSPPDVFVNLHPADFLDEALFDADSPLTPFAKRIVLEVTERAALDERAGIPERVARLRERGYQIAIDDLGAGYAGLTYFAVLAPEIVKIDMSLIRGIDRDAVKRKLVGSMTAVCRDLGMLVVAEGIETPAERDACAELACDLMQGYLFAKPGRPFPEVAW
jgi:EAL domain-containing protein (putative c-di-GMP-specific phosphodiesterase class I)